MKQNRDKVRDLPIKNVTFEGGFWGPKFQIYKRNMLANGWAYMKWNMNNLKKANGLPYEEELDGTWGEANLGKHLESCALSLGVFPDQELEARIDDVVKLLKNIQQPDGYLHCYIQLAGKPHWDPEFLDGSHEGYVRGHMTEAALAYYETTGKREFLDIMIRAADEAYEHFLGEKGVDGFCGHAEYKMALVDLTRVTGNPRYQELAKAWVDWRGKKKVKRVGETPDAYFQDHARIADQPTLEGHAVRAVFFASGVVDLALETGDLTYRAAAQRFWASAAQRRMYVSGGVGAREEHEAFGEDYELPGKGYAESCAANGLIDFAHRMFKLEVRSEYIDVMERVIYNNLLHSIALDGMTTYYRNLLSDESNPRNNCWVCCPPNIARTLFRLGRYAYAHRSKDIYMNLFVAGSAIFPLGSGSVRLDVSTQYPWEGSVSVKVTLDQDTRFALNIRVPAWCQDASIKVNGKARKTGNLERSDEGYVRIQRTWSSGDRVEVILAMPVVRLEAHPNIADGKGKAAIQRGPVVYGLESLDNDGRVDITLPTDPEFRTERKTNLLGDIMVIKGKSNDGSEFTAIPYFAMANRENARQEVWLKQDGIKPSTSWWCGNLYRPLTPDRLTVPVQG